MVPLTFTTQGTALVPVGAVAVEDGTPASARMAAGEPRSVRINGA